MRAAVDTSQRGVLFPEALPTRFRRVPPRAEVSSLVAWWWLSEWSLPPGEVSEQHLIAFPSCNLAVEAIDDYILDLTGKTSPKVCFVPTASGDAPDYGKRFEAAFQGRARTSLLSLFGGGAYDYTDPHVLLDQDVVYVGGGSTANLLALWRLHGVPDLLAQAAENGTVLAGISAGANCWFEACSTDSFSPLAPLADGLGFAKGSICPHYLGEEHRRATYQRWVASGELPPGYAVDDYAAVVLRDGALVDVISERSGTVAYRVDADCEHPLEVRRL